MNKLIKALAGVALTLAPTIAGAANYAWPANYVGVMLQGFYWDSYTDTKWTNLTSQCDELSKYFTLIWVPNSAKSASGYMGYDPVYWFTNHNTRFGTEAELRAMIAAYKEKNVGIIEDVVVNHRSGKSNWTDFPAETWNGRTWQLGPEHICSTDEVRNASGQATPTGAPDTGDDFDGSRDLDHTNPTVQDNVKNYCKFLLDDMGYSGFRYDMVKGYAGRFNKIYNEYAKPRFSVGEYWDASYDALAAWIEATGRQSAAFDFAFKYAVNEAFHSGDLTKLVWKANGTTDQPAGLIHFGYPQYAVTFIDNHDTYRDGSKFNGNVPAANAFMLFSPGTPCVFLPHYKENKAAIQKMIDIRNSAGVHNMSTVKVLRSSADCYMAEITGTKGKVVVKVGSAMVSPEGYSDSDIKASGNDYCIWTKVNVISGSETSGGTGSGDDSGIVSGGEAFNVYFDNSSTHWSNPYIHYWGAEESTWPGVAMSKVEGEIWTYKVPAGTTGLLFNAGDGDATKTSDFVAVANGLYTVTGQSGTYDGSGTGDNNFPEKLYLIGTINGATWQTSLGLLPDEAGDGVYVYRNVTIDEADKGYGYITFITSLDSSDGDWNGVNQGDRYGATEEDAKAELNSSVAIRKYAYMVDAMSAASWAVAPGEYTVTADLKAMKLTLASATSVETVDIFDAETPRYFNMQGVEVHNPSAGIYIVRRGNRVTKEIVRR